MPGDWLPVFRFQSGGGPPQFQALARLAMNRSAEFQFGANSQFQPTAPNWNSALRRQGREARSTTVGFSLRRQLPSQGGGYGVVKLRNRAAISAAGSFSALSRRW